VRDEQSAELTRLARMRLMREAGLTCLISASSGQGIGASQRAPRLRKREYDTHGQGAGAVCTLEEDETLQDGRTGQRSGGHRGSRCGGRGVGCVCPAPRELAGAAGGHITTHWHPPSAVCWLNGSSPLVTGPHTDGTWRACQRAIQGRAQRGAYEVVLRVLAVADEAGDDSVSAAAACARPGGGAHLLAASLARMRGRVRSSRRRWLCSVSRRSLSSDMLCLCGRALIVSYGAGAGAKGVNERLAAASAARVTARGAHARGAGERNGGGSERGPGGSGDPRRQCCLLLPSRRHFPSTSDSSAYIMPSTSRTQHAAGGI
jgi:hypothetical protein